jgi:hypothetical protein
MCCVCIFSLRQESPDMILGDDSPNFWGGSVTKGARYDFWGCDRIALLRLVAKLSHVGADVDRLACSLHWPTDCSWQTRVQSLLTCIILSCCTVWASVALDHLFGEGVWSPRDGAFVMVLTAPVPGGHDSLWRNLLLSRWAYLMS